MTDKITVLSDSELDAVTGGWFSNYKSFNFQQNNAGQAAQNNQVALVNVPILSGQSNQQGVGQSNGIT